MPPWTAHPRMRGEHSATDSTPGIHAGSSPHARGAPRRSSPLRLRPGLIPACAGSTSSTVVASPRTWAHPRMRGEHGGGGGPVTFRPGSSPHARGARPVPRGVNVRRRLIPACAGSTRPCWGRILPLWAHPRMRGEHVTGAEYVVHTPGSSPHARGAPITPDADPLNKRLIPACAGSTPLWTPPSCPTRAHPRMRGEHADPGARRRDVAGSSPHARGAHRDHPHQPGFTRLIPACAGSTAG